MHIPIVPLPLLGLVIWNDNPFAAWTSEGRIGYGVLENETVWKEIEGIRIQQ